MKRKMPVLDAEAVARKVAAMTLGRAQARQARLAAQAKLLAEYTSMDLVGIIYGASNAPASCSSDSLRLPSGRHAADVVDRIRGRY